MREVGRIRRHRSATAAGLAAGADAQGRKKDSAREAAPSKWEETPAMSLRSAESGANGETDVGDRRDARRSLDAGAARNGGMDGVEGRDGRAGRARRSEGARRGLDVGARATEPRSRRRSTSSVWGRRTSAGWATALCGGAMKGAPGRMAGCRMHDECSGRARSAVPVGLRRGRMGNKGCERAHRALPTWVSASGRARAAR